MANIWESTTQRLVLAFGIWVHIVEGVDLLAIAVASRAGRTAAVRSS